MKPFTAKAQRREEMRAKESKVMMDAVSVTA